MNDRIPGTTYSDPIWHGRWRIYLSDMSRVHGYQWAYVHDDYDGAPDGNDNRCGHGHTVEACKAEIDEWEEDHTATSAGTPVFTEDDDYVKRASIRCWFQAGPGSLVQTPDGKMWTVVYNNLDGWGVVEGDRPELINAEDDQLPPHSHLLRNYAEVNGKPVHDKPCIGELVRIFRRVKDDGTVLDYSSEIALATSAPTLTTGSTSTNEESAKP